MRVTITLPQSQIDRWCGEANAVMDEFVDTWLWPHMCQSFAQAAYYWTPPCRRDYRIDNRDVKPISLIAQARRGTLTRPQDIAEFRRGAKYKVVKIGNFYKRPYFTKYFYHGRTQIGKQARIETRGLAKLSWYKGLYDSPGRGLPGSVEIRPAPQALTHISRNGENWKHARGRWDFRRSAGLWHADVHYLVDYVKVSNVPTAAQPAVDASLRNSIDRFNNVRAATYWTGRSRRSRRH